MENKWLRYVTSLILSLIVMLFATSQIRYFGIQPMLEEPIKITAARSGGGEEPIDLRIQSIEIDGRKIPYDELNLSNNWWSQNDDADYPIYYKGPLEPNEITIPFKWKHLGKDVKVEVKTVDTHTMMGIQHGHVPTQFFKYNRNVGHHRMYTLNLLKPTQLLAQFGVVAFGIVGLTIFLSMYVLVPFEEEKVGWKEWRGRFKSLFSFVLLPMITALLSLLVWYIYYQDKSQDIPYRLLHLPSGAKDTLAFYFIVGGGSLGLKALLKRYTWLSKLVNGLMFLLIPYIGVFLTEIAYSNRWTELPINYLFINWFIVLLFQGLIYVLFRSYKVSLATTVISMTILGIANQILITLRDSPVIPSFLKTIDVALQVSEGGFGISLNNKSLWSLSLMGLWLIVISALQERDYHLTLKRYFLPLASYLLVFVGTFFSLTRFYFQTTDDIGFSWWRPANSYMHRGTVWSFFYLLANSKLTEPEGYSAEAVSEILEPYYQTVPEMKDKPNIILIQSESLMDYHGLNEVLYFNHDPLERTKALTEDFIQGKLYVSVIGGGTVKTEYEVLSSNQLAYFPGDHDPFWQHVEEGSYSIANFLGELGYNTYAGHPHVASNYYRDQSWPRLGFEETYFFDDYADHPSYYRFRSYVSDQTVFEHLIDIYEKNGDEPFFFFANTMQNHSAYPGTYFEPGIKVLQFDNVSPEVEEYANIVKKSDEAFEDLTSYFAKVDEPTIIAIYGDHQPYHYDQYLDMAFGIDEYELTDYYYAPFYIWANYDIDHMPDMEISANYLVPLFLNQASDNMPLSAYYRYLLAQIEKYPILTTNFNYDAESNEVTDDPDFQAFLKELDLVIYSNVMRDKETRQYFEPVH